MQYIMQLQRCTRAHSIQCTTQLHKPTCTCAHGIPYMWFFKVCKFREFRGRDRFAKLMSLTHMSHWAGPFVKIKVENQPFTEFEYLEYTVQLHRPTSTRVHSIQYTVQLHRPTSTRAHSIQYTVQLHRPTSTCAHSIQYTVQQHRPTSTRAHSIQY